MPANTDVRTAPAASGAYVVQVSAQRYTLVNFMAKFFDNILPGLEYFDLGPILNQQQVLDNAKQIVDMIQTQVEPESWSINNGPGKIVFDPVRMVLVVKASAEVHYMLGGGGK